MKLYILIQEVRVFGRLISAKVLGEPGDYDREVTVTYPTMAPQNPTADNAWDCSDVPTFTAADLKTALDSLGYTGDSAYAVMGRFMMKPTSDVAFSAEAHLMPCIGNVQVTNRTIEIEV